MLWGSVVPTVIAAIIFIEAEVGAITGRANILATLLRGFKLGDVVENVKRHGQQGDDVVVAEEPRKAAPLYQDCRLLSSA